MRSQRRAVPRPILAPFSDGVCSRAANPTRSERDGSRPPQAGPLQLLDDDLVLRGSAALGTEEGSVCIARGLRALPSAEPAHRVVDARQKKSSNVSFRSVFWTATTFVGVEARNVSWSNVACVDPMYRARSSQP